VPHPWTGTAAGAAAARYVGGSSSASDLCHWILEIRLTDTARRFGGFYEQLLDLG